MGKVLAMNWMMGKRQAGLTRFAVVGGLLLALSACGSDQTQGAATKAMLQTIKKATTRLAGGGKEQPASQAADSPASLIGAALKATDGPVMIVVIEKRSAIAIMGLSQTNGDYETWMAADRRTLSFKRGILTSSRGLGDDLMSSRVDPAVALITARKSGTASRSYQYLNGVGYTTNLPVQCVIQPGGREKIDIGEVSSTTTRVAEVCQNGPMTLQNLYWVDSSGHVLKSRQWLGQMVGYVTIQRLRR